jgi:hypothetical protein
MKKVESLKIGDVVRVSEEANVPVRYLGHRGVIKCMFGKSPVRIHLGMSGRKSLLVVRQSEVAKIA